MGQQEPDSLLRYLDALASSYPEQINQAELAKRAGVSEAAVSQQREKLYEFSVKDKFAFHGLVLSQEPPVVARVAWLFLSNRMFSKFIMSRYGRAFIDGLDLHGRITAAFPQYPRFFTRDDTSLMAATVIAQLTALDKIGQIRFPAAEIEERIGEVSAQFINVGIEVISHLKFDIRSEKRLQKWIGIRDKWYYFIESAIFEMLPHLEILNHVPDREAYVEVYRNTFSFYLKKAFEPITGFLRERATQGGVDFNPRFEPVGAVFTPQLAVS